MIAEEGAIYSKSYAFAIRIVNAYKFLSEQRKEFVLSKQLLRSGTAVGALLAEARFAQSRADFLNKMNVALKEANETSYWFSLLKDTHYIDDDMHLSISSDCNELVALLVSIVKAFRESLGKQK